MSINASLVKDRQIAAARAAWIATIPSDPEQPWPFTTVDEYVQARFEQMAESWRDSVMTDRITTAEFMLRFEPAEFATLVAAANVDSVAAGFLARLRAETHVWLGSDEALQAKDYIVNGGLLTQVRADEIWHFDMPQPPQVP